MQNLTFAMIEPERGIGCMPQMQNLPRFPLGAATGRFYTPGQAPFRTG